MRQLGLTEEILDECSVDGGCRHVAKDNDGSRHFAQAELLRCLGEGVVGVERLGRDLACDLAHGQLVGIENVLGPVLNGLVKDGLVEDVVVAKGRVAAAHTGVVLEHVVDIEHVEREEGGIGLRVGNEGHLEHERPQGRVKVDAIVQGADDDLFGQVTAVVGEEAVVRKGVHHGAGATDYCQRFLRKANLRQDRWIDTSETYSRRDRQEPSCPLSLAEHNGGWQRRMQPHRKRRERRSSLWSCLVVGMG